MLRSTRYSISSRTVEPVTIDELRRQLRLEHGEDDTDLADFIIEAREELEAKLGDRALINGTVTEYFDNWPDKAIELHWSPVSSITSVKYYDSNEVLQTLASTVYELGTRHGMGIVRLKYDQVWPSLRGHDADDIVVTYVAGEGTSRSNVPKSLRRWLKMRASWLWANRDGAEYPWNNNQMDALLMPYRRVRVHG